MQLLTHVLAGWVGGNVVTTTGRERLGCMAISLLSDIDGLGLVLSREAYLRFHHVVAHNLLVGILASTALMMILRSRIEIGLLFLTLFHLHLLMDFLGSGPGWGLTYLWPFSVETFTSPMSWEFRSWQNYLVLAALAFATLWIAYTRRRTPLEVVAPRLDAILARRPMPNTSLERTRER